MTSQDSATVDTATASPASRGDSAARFPRLARLWTPPRLLGLDIARGLAVLGMVVAHTTDTPPFDWTDTATWPSIVDGRSSVLFAVAAGVSLALMTRNAPRDDDELRRERLRIVGRAIAVFAIGLFLEAFLPGATIILCVYGLAFLALVPAVHWPPRVLIAIAIGLAVLGSVIRGLVTPTGLPAVGTAVLNGLFPLVPWVALMLVGLAVGRTSIQRPRTAVALLFGGAVAAAFAYGVSVLVLGPEQTFGYVMEPSLSWENFLSVAPHSGSLLELVGSGGFAVAVIGACLLLARPLRWIALPVAALGSMSLTSYVAHYLPLRLAPSEDPALGLWVSLGLLVATTVWAATVGQGPLERLVDAVGRGMARDPRTLPARVDRPTRREPPAVTPGENAPAPAPTESR